MLHCCRSLRTAAAAAATPAVDGLRKKAYARFALQRTPREVMQREEFIQLVCAASPDPRFRMTPAEASEFLTAMREARAVVVNEADGLVFTKPLAVVNDVHARLGVPPLSLESRASIAAAADAEKTIAAADAAATNAAINTALWRKRFWSGVALASGTQMAILSYLTFVLWDWDTMEPICFFLTSGTSLLFYAYFILFRREHSLQQVDQHVLPGVFARNCTAGNVDVKRWMSALEETAAAAATKDKKQ